MKPAHSKLSVAVQPVVTPVQESKNCDKKKTKAHAFPEFGETENKDGATETERWESVE
jgi:hypothetical protein